MSSRSIRSLLLACTAIGAVCVASVDANAGGLAVREQSAYSQGASFAGMAAGGDLSGMFLNPAVMTQFDGIQSSSSYSAFLGYQTQTPTGGTYFGSPFVTQGSTNNNALSAMIPASYMSYQVNPNLWIGLSFNAPFGLALSYPESWVGRDYAAGSTQLTTYNATPSVAYKLNNWISVGAGMQIQYAKASLQHGVSALVPRVGIVPVGDAALNGNGWAYGFTAGITLTPGTGTTIGLGYRSGLNQKISGTIASPLGVVPAEATLNLPGTLSLGIRQRLTAPLTLLGTVEWTNWKRIGTATVTSNGAVATTIPFQYQDGWLFSLGAEYMMSDRLTLRTGIGYEISPVTDQVRIPLLPDNDRIWASVGGSYEIWKGFTAHLAYSHVFVRDTTVNVTAASGNPSFNGISYTGTANQHADILSVGMKYRWK